jgi:hypothetical protein
MEVTLVIVVAAAVVVVIVIVIHVALKFCGNESSISIQNKKTNSMALVRERTIPTKRLPLVDEVRASLFRIEVKNIQMMLKWPPSLYGAYTIMAYVTSMKLVIFWYIRSVATAFQIKLFNICMDIKHK